MMYYHILFYSYYIFDIIKTYNIGPNNFYLSANVTDIYGKSVGNPKFFR